MKRANSYAPTSREISADDTQDVRCRKNHLQTPKRARTVTRPDGRRFKRCLICTADNQRRYDEARRLFQKGD